MFGYSEADETYSSPDGSSTRFVNCSNPISAFYLMLGPDLAQRACTDCGKRELKFILNEDNT
jgi:hypothetical protein